MCTLYWKNCRAILRLKPSPKDNAIATQQQEEKFVV